MTILINVLLAIWVLVALLMVLVILMQRPKSEGLCAAIARRDRHTAFARRNGSADFAVTGSGSIANARFSARLGCAGFRRRRFATGQDDSGSFAGRDASKAVTLRFA